MGSNEAEQSIGVGKARVVVAGLDGRTAAEASAAERAVESFRRRYTRAPTLLARAPGRVNLIGEHTDYNLGFVLPMALPFETVIAAEPWSEAAVEVTSEGFGADTIDLTAPPSATAGWARYVHGMGTLLPDQSIPVGGWRGAIATDIPTGASLSSSAAIEVAAGLVFAAVVAGAEAASGSMILRRVAATGTRVENEVLGLPSGIMDQLASALGEAGRALLIDCRSEETTPVSFPDEAIVVILDTGTRRRLVDSAFAQRRATCHQAAQRLGIASLRDLSSDDLASPWVHKALGDDVTMRRVRHVVTENERTLAAVEAIGGRDLVTLGRLMAESHRSLSEDYEVSGPSLDAMVVLAREAPGCLGARLTGGGFAGCAVGLVIASEVDRFCQWVAARYQPPADQPAAEAPALYPVRPSAGASIEAW